MITLTTDFGTDSYVAEMKGVIYTINPSAKVIDASHSITKYSILEAAFFIYRMYKYFPPHTIHLAVVDPGVGTSRLPVAIESESYFFVGPDNGIFTLAIKEQELRKIVVIEEERIKSLTSQFLQLPSVSCTFHGRDIFAPAAALIDKGIEIEKLGYEIEKLTKLEVSADQVVYIDSFGNVITTCKGDFKVGENVVVEVKGKKHLARFVRTFGEVEEGKMLVLKGSSGYLEVDVNKGNAAKMLGVKVGEKIRILKS